MSERIPVFHPAGGRLLTKQAMRDETDANRIMEKWITQGQFPRGPAGQPMYGDFASGLSYHECLERVQAASLEFQALPSRVRTACRNDPGVFLEFCSDPERLKELHELGLNERDVPEAVVKVHVVNGPEVIDEPVVTEEPV